MCQPSRFLLNRTMDVMARNLYLWVIFRGQEDIIFTASEAWNHRVFMTSEFSHLICENFSGHFGRGWGVRTPWYPTSLNPPLMSKEWGLHDVIICVLFSAPTGELVPAKMVLQPDGEYKVEYSSRFTGKCPFSCVKNVDRSVIGD